MRKRLRYYIAFLLTIIFCFSTVTAFAQTPPAVDAAAAILVEAETGQVVYEKNADKLMYPASMTKLLTAIVALETLALDEVVIVGREVNEISLDSSKAGHIVGESITVENLIRGLMIPSGNDSGLVIACAVSKKLTGDSNLTPEESELYFSNLMNAKALELGCTNTNFTNPHGYHDSNHYTTAEDMAKIAQAALKIEIVKEICSERRYAGNSMGLQDSTGLTTLDYNWLSHNELITAGENSYPYATGLKTGFTNEAGQCVAASAEKDGVELIAIVFDSPDPGRWQDAAELFEYGFNNYSIANLGKADDVVGEVGLRNHKAEQGSTLSLIIKEDLSFYLENSVISGIKTEISITNEDYIYEDKDENGETVIKINAPIESDVRLGTVKYKSGDVLLAELDIYSGRDVEEASLLEKITYGFKSFIGKLFTVKGLIITLATVVIVVVLVLLIRFIINRNQRPKNKYKFKKTRRRF